MSLLKIIQKRRSVRKFKKYIPALKEIRNILEAGRWAPSGLNNQPWRFMIIKEKNKKNGLASFTHYDDIIKESPILIAVFLNVKESYNRDKDIMAIGACIQNMLLYIHSIGLGACWLGEILNKKEKVCRYLGLKKSLELMAVISLGYPAEKNVKSSRKSLKSLLIK